MAGDHDDRRKRTDNSGSDDGDRRNVTNSLIAAIAGLVTAFGSYQGVDSFISFKAEQSERYEKLELELNLINREGTSGLSVLRAEIDQRTEGRFTDRDGRVLEKGISVNSEAVSELRIDMKELRMRIRDLESFCGRAPKR